MITWSFIKNILLRIIIYGWLWLIFFIYLGHNISGSFLHLYVEISTITIIIVSIYCSFTKYDKFFLKKIFTHKKTKIYTLSLILLFWISILITWLINDNNPGNAYGSMRFTYTLFLLSFPGSLVLDLATMWIDIGYDQCVVSTDECLNEMRMRHFFIWLYYFVIFFFQVYILTTIRRMKDVA